LAGLGLSGCRYEGRIGSHWVEPLVVIKGGVACPVALRLSGCACEGRFNSARVEPLVVIKGGVAGLRGGGCACEEKDRGKAVRG